MSLGERIAGMVPYVVGAVAGTAVAAVVGFSADWIVTTGAMRQAVADTEVELLASFCAQEVEESWQGEVPEELGGLGNREKRMDLAEKFTPVLPAEPVANEEAVDECAEMIRDLATG